MTKSEATSKIDAVEVGDVRISLTAGGMGGSQFNMMMVSADYALVVSSDDAKVGKGTLSSWSPATQEKIRELLVSMESDICVAVFGKPPQAVEGAIADDPHSDGVPQL